MKKLIIIFMLVLGIAGTSYANNTGFNPSALTPCPTGGDVRLEGTLKNQNNFYLQGVDVILWNEDMTNSCADSDDISIEYDFTTQYLAKQKTTYYLVALKFGCDPYMAELEFGRGNVTQPFNIVYHNVVLQCTS